MLLRLVVFILPALFFASINAGLSSFVEILYETGAGREETMCSGTAKKIESDDSSFYAVYFNKLTPQHKEWNVKDGAQFQNWVEKHSEYQIWATDVPGNVVPELDKSTWERVQLSTGTGGVLQQFFTCHGKPKTPSVVASKKQNIESEVGKRPTLNKRSYTMATLQNRASSEKIAN